MTVVTLPLAASVALDEYRESVLDGAWVGTASRGAATLPLSLVLNVNANGGVATVLSLDEDGAVLALAAEVTGVSGGTVELRVEDAAEGDVVTFALQYKNLSDSLQGTLQGGGNGTVQLARMDAAVPLQRLWQGTFKGDGGSQTMVLQLQEEPVGRSAAIGVTGNFWVDGEHGELTGMRDGNDFELLLDADGEVFELAGKISKGIQLKSKLSGDGSKVKVKLLAAPGRGKPAKLVAPVPATLEADASHVVQVKGKNLAPGSLVEVSDPGLTVTEVIFRTSKLLEATLAVGEGLAGDTVLGLRLLGSDGQNPERKAALTIDAPDGGAGVSFAASVQPIFTGNCALAGCHVAGTAEGGLVLSPGSAFQNIVNAPSTQQPSLQRVTPGNADASYLVRKIRGDAGISGGRMPLNRPPLSNVDIATIIAWINEGAANNGPIR